jgi:hypothetical protein
MMQNNKLVVLLLVLCAGLTGCGTIPSYEDMGYGYVEATYMRASSWAPTAMRTELLYKKGIWKVTIWPHIYNDIVTNNVAIFSAGKAYDPPYPGEPLATRWRLFVVKAPDLPLDITDEVVWRFAKQLTGKLAIISTRPDLLNQINIGVVGNQTNGLEFNAYLKDVGHEAVRVDLSQIPDIMHEVKEKGVVRKDRVWGTSYIEKEFKPEEQK